MKSLYIYLQFGKEKVRASSFLGISIFNIGLVYAYSWFAEATSFAMKREFPNNNKFVNVFFNACSNTDKNKFIKNFFPLSILI